MSNLTEILKTCLSEFEEELFEAGGHIVLEDLICDIEKHAEEQDEIAGEKYRAELSKQGVG